MAFTVYHASAGFVYAKEYDRETASFYIDAKGERSAKVTAISTGFRCEANAVALALEGQRKSVARAQEALEHMQATLVRLEAHAAALANGSKAVQS